ncbi:unnamed protein product [Candidula unifasciata]|uniref:CCD97-like C-terminal domain-containing protein n=1 Tax=Candidula unifasciata TaxID=100452 RepID=A0A8S3ZJJ6_9EUPU|nr:unnamed protein product [Candidula unifasciata]
MAVEANIENSLKRNISHSNKEDLKNQMIIKLVKTDAHFRHQQRGEPDLTQEEKISIAEDILNKNPALFLERYSQYLNSEDIRYFEDQKGNYLIDFYVEEISKRCADSRQNVVKNRRYQALQKLIDEGEYFSENEMKWREPLLYEQMVGQYVTESEKAAQMEQEIDKSDLRFSSILLKHLDMQTNKQVYEFQKEKEGEQEEEEEKESNENISEADTDDEEEIDNKKEKISEAERMYFRDEFLRTMQEKFLSGQDASFDYSKVDNNADYDSLDIAGHDAEEKYFDADEDSDSSANTVQRRDMQLTSCMDESGCNVAER